MILFDLPVYQFIISTFWPTTLLTTIMKLITSLGSALFIITGILCVAILIKDKKYFKIFLIANLIGVILNNIIKLIIKRPRPTQTILLASETSYSFPSGHSMSSLIFYGLLIYYICKFIKNKKIKTLLVALLSAIIFFIGISRIYLGVHYATDVIGGYLIGLIYLVVFLKITNKKLNSQKKTEGNWQFQSIFL